MRASEPVAPSVMFRSGSTFAYPLTQALNSGRIRVEPVSESVSEAECAANVPKAMPAVNTVARTMLVRRQIIDQSFSAGGADRSRLWIPMGELRTTVANVLLRNDDIFAVLCREALNHANEK